MEINKRSEGRPIKATVFLHRRDYRNDTACNHGVRHSFQKRAF
jgi:hypothetical protein